ncbi:cuticle protein 10.9-like [Stegodyphus dumicola]|uniref:cuticle protein 10.9-like n=1 Tax=Stegodyphus dumicola TaxID=202533 RepID=UPI0015AFAFF1|nr:cuticle protein 10.9-like [Stegodyphus dumicola]XP_035214995.1 cuticle protein 10.9-like [Stegodyphus dumicola]
MMFKALLLVSLAAAAMAQYGYGHEGGYGGAGYGHQDYAQPIPYQYGYEIQGDHGEFKQNRAEHGDGHGNVQGSYGYTDAHGIYRQVDYVADHHGFRAQVKTNEPGTESQSPADVELHAQPVQVHQPAYSAPQHAGYGYY